MPKTTSKSKKSGALTEAKLRNMIAKEIGKATNPHAYGHNLQPSYPQSEGATMFPPPGRDYHTERLNRVTAPDGQQYLRIDCPTGQFPDYQDGECKQISPFNMPCKKDEVWDRYTGQCRSAGSTELRRPGIQWDAQGNAKNIGIPYKNTAFNELGRLRPGYKNF